MWQNDEQAVSKIRRRSDGMVSEPPASSRRSALSSYLMRSVMIKSLPACPLRLQEEPIVMQASLS